MGRVSVLKMSYTAPMSPSTKRSKRGGIRWFGVRIIGWQRSQPFPF